MTRSKGQRVNINKGGINATLPAETAMLGYRRALVALKHR